ncbi:MAG: hypothetical protein U0232_31010 [Thermomicrobiales bacterium]
MPVATARLLGADIVMAIDLSEPLGPRQGGDGHDGEPPRKPNLLDAILRSRDIMMSRSGSTPPVSLAILITPCRCWRFPAQLQRRREVYRTGERAAELALQRIYELPLTATPTEAEPPYL